MSIWKSKETLLGTEDCEKRKVLGSITPPDICTQDQVQILTSTSYLITYLLQLYMNIPTNMACFLEIKV